MVRICGTLLIFALTLLTFACNALAQVPRFAVISDTHFYDTDLGTSGSAFENYLALDRKMLRESEEILVSALDTIKAQAPDFLLISGDLTKDGERSGHLKLAEYLSDLENGGIQVFVIPGNHDINNPHAMTFDGDETHPVDTVNAEDFAMIYGDFGYNQAIDRDPSSLSYVAEPEDGLWLIGIDSCKYEDNLTNGYPETGGAISSKTLGWILKKLMEAKRRNKVVFGFMHHGILKHFNGQPVLFGEYVIDNWRGVSDLLSAAGLQLMFTGHYHANDITQSKGLFNRLYDVETGSLVTYPCSIRLVELNGDSADIGTLHVETIDDDSLEMPFTEYARDFLLEGVTSIAEGQLTMSLADGGFGLSGEDALIEAPFVAQAFLAHYSGDESPDDETLEHISDFINTPDIHYRILGLALSSIWNDLAPADNNVVLPLK